jgi:triosephosphate isomerase
VNPGARRPLVVGNWKLHKTLGESRALAQAVVDATAGLDVEVAVAPVYTALACVREVVAKTHVGLAAQNAFWEPQGAFTGEVSAALLQDAGCAYVIVGHSERRQLFGETDEQVARKVKAVLERGMTPIVCVGESLAEREAGQTENRVLHQLDAACAGLAVPGSLVVAYEPIWAIGTGRNALPEDAQAVHARLRSRLAGRFGPALADAVRILYGGSVKPDNARSLLLQTDVDGALVGGASLEAAAFSSIVEAARA